MLNEKLANDQLEGVRLERALSGNTSRVCFLPILFLRVAERLSFRGFPKPQREDDLPRMTGFVGSITEQFHQLI